MSDTKKNGSEEQGSLAAKAASNTPSTPATAPAAQEAPAKPLLGNVGRRAELLCKSGPVYAYNGKKYDLREIPEATAVALANDPRCMFIIWKEESKRPKHQRIYSLDGYVNP